MHRLQKEGHGVTEVRSMAAGQNDTGIRDFWRRRAQRWPSRIRFATLQALPL
jgi:hypothetical protein